MKRTIAVPRVSREFWESHPNYPAQTLLLGSHAGFLHNNALLIGAARDGDAPGRLEWPYRSWISAMRSHEAYEELKLYPYLVKRWGASFEEATAGHEALHERHAAVLSAFGELRASTGADNARASLVKALQEHDVTLRAHLQLEEELVIPLLLELSADEFETYRRSSIAELGLSNV